MIAYRGNLFSVQMYIYIYIYIYVLVSGQQYLPNKPHKWSFKMFTRAGVSGIIYDFILYIGEGLRISSDIVLELASNILENQNF